jgi:peptidoglycan hydrolase CwlO-like protein
MGVERQRHAAVAANLTKLETVRTELQAQLATARQTHGQFERQIATLNGELEANEQRMREAQREEKERVRKTRRRRSSSSNYATKCARRESPCSNRC